MSRQARWLFLFVFLALVVGIMFGLRFATTFGDAFRRIKYVPIRVDRELTWNMNQHVTEYDGDDWVVLWSQPSY